MRYYLKTKDIEDDKCNVFILFEIQKYIKEKYKIDSSIVKREYIKGLNSTNH